LSFYLWNSSGEIINQTLVEVSGISNSSNFTVYNLGSGTYNWNCYAGDLKNNFGFAVNNFSMTIGGVVSLLNSPLDNNYTNLNNTNFSCSVESISDYELVNVTFSLWNSSDLIYDETKEISGFDNDSVFNYSFEYGDNYVWNCLGVNNNSDADFGNSNFSVVYDLSLPNISLNSPASGSSYTTNSQSVNFDFNVSDNLNISCELIVNNVAVNSSDLMNITNYSFTNVYTPGTYNWEINCTDLAGNIGNSSQWSFVVNSPASGSSSSPGGGSSSGGGGGSKMLTHTFTNFNVGKDTSRSLKVNDKIKISYDDETHIINLDLLSENSVVVTVSSEAQTFTLNLGNEKKVDLDGDDYYDLNIKLNKIENNMGEINVKRIKELIVFENKNVEEPILSPEENETAGITGAVVGDINNKDYIILLLEIVVILLIVFLGYYVIHGMGKGYGKEAKTKSKRK